MRNVLRSKHFRCKFFRTPPVVRQHFILCEIAIAAVTSIWRPTHSTLMIANRGLGQQPASATGGTMLSTSPVCQQSRPGQIASWRCGDGFLRVPMIRLTDTSKTFDEGRSFAVRDLSLEVQDGETRVLLGSSGYGKTTTLKMVNRLVEPDSGTVTVDGRCVTEHDILPLRRSIGYVFQGIGLFPHMTIEQNVAVVPKLLGWPPDRRTARAHEMLSLVELDPVVYGRRRPGDLTGLAMAIAILIGVPTGIVIHRYRAALTSRLVWTARSHRPLYQVLYQRAAFSVVAGHRLTKRRANGETRRPAQPVPETAIRRVCHRLAMWSRADSNRRPTGCKPVALPTELRPLVRPEAGSERRPAAACSVFSLALS